MRNTTVRQGLVLLLVACASKGVFSQARTTAECIEEQGAMARAIAVISAYQLGAAPFPSGWNSAAWSLATPIIKGRTGENTSWSKYTKGRKKLRRLVRSSCDVRRSKYISWLTSPQRECSKSNSRTRLRQAAWASWSLHPAGGEGAVVPQSRRPHRLPGAEKSLSDP